MVSVKLVTFDVTGTLLLFRIPIFEKYIATGLQYGIQIDSDALKKNFKSAWRTLNLEHPNFGRDTGLGSTNWWRKFVERTYSEFKKPANVQLRQIADELLKFHTTADAFTIRPGALELLGYLKGRNVQMGVISNYDERLNTVLEVTDLNKYFNFVLVSYKVGYVKPNKNIFKEAMALGNCSLGSECVHIGDDVELDYHGARRAGMNAILIKENQEENIMNEVDDNDVFPDFFSIKKHFEKVT